LQHKLVTVDHASCKVIEGQPIPPIRRRKRASFS
jgi:hypothetical protein